MKKNICIILVISGIIILGISNIANTYSQKMDTSNTLQQESSNIILLTTNNNMSSNSVKTINAQSTLLVKLLSNNLEDHVQKTAAILNITSKLPQVRNASYAHLLNQTLMSLHGIPKDADLQKRQVAQNILSAYKELQIIIFIMPNGDIYFDEPYSRQQISTVTNLTFRDYFKGVLKTNDTYLGDPSTSASSGQRLSVIAVPVYSLKDNSTFVGIWAGEKISMFLVKRSNHLI